MRKILFLLVILVCVAGTRALADSLTVVGLSDKTVTHQTQVDEKLDIIKPLWYDEWQAAYPRTRLRVNWTVPYSSSSLVRALQDGKMKQDVLALSSELFDWSAAASSGGLMDLSDDPELVELVSQMHPLFSEAAYQGGGLYGIPCEVMFSPMVYCNVWAWEEAGYTAEDMPSSFASLMDFLEDWVARCEKEPAQDIRVSWDFSNYTQVPYVSWLVNLLLQHRINQCEAEGIAITFNTPEIVSLLERASIVGRAIFAMEPAPQPQPDTNEVYLLESTMQTPRKLPQMIPYRMSDSDQQLIPVYVTYLCVPKNCANPEAARAFIRLYMRCLREHVYDDPMATTAWDGEALMARALLFADVTGDIWAYDYGVAEIRQQGLAKQEAIASNPSADAKRRELAERAIERFEHGHMLERAAEQEYVFTAEQLALYQATVSSLRVVNSHSMIADGKTAQSLVNQFVAGRITAQEFVERMDAQQE
ncbi:MAG: extracellular solute-binding protein [Christensenellaceae bacterium]|nr:extracellular solute-binding protein [Christensenellaceae bacterium]